MPAHASKVFRLPPLLLVAPVFLLVLSGCGAARSPAEGAKAPEFKFAFDEDRAFGYLEKQCAFGPRNPGSKGHSECLRWMTAELGTSADRVISQHFTRTLDGRPLAFTNVLAVYDPPEGTHRWIILAAHWDTRPIADQETDAAKSRQPIPGANDGASGVAVLMELGRLFQSRRPPAGIIIAMFDGEDYGVQLSDMFIGSTRFARDWKSVLNGVTANIEYGILLDMVGAKDMRIEREQNSERAAPRLMDHIWATASQAGLDDYFPNVPGRAIRDDHLPLIEAGIPTVDLIAFDYGWWHTLEDTPDKCSPRSLKVVGEVVARTVYSDFRH